MLRRAGVALLRKNPYVAPQYLSRTDGQYNSTFAELTVKTRANRRSFCAKPVRSNPDGRKSDSRYAFVAKNDTSFAAAT
jgi:hypothetical protein